jgi:murein DD-endopeptidase MepM/ murein hydrolase activator NlpD
MAKFRDYVLKSPKVTSKYGKRTHPITGEKDKMHYGEDLTSSDKNIYAVEDGYVQKIKTGQDKATTGYGNYIWVRYPRTGMSLFHAHCKSIKLKKGDTVKKGDVIAIMGSTGASTGTHLHLGMTKIGSDTWLDPASYNYEEPKKEVVVEDKTKEYEEKINELNKKVEELELRVKQLQSENELLLQDLKDAGEFKFRYEVLDTKKYKIKLNKGEVLYIY